MAPDEVCEQLAGTSFGPVRFVSSTGSTNADLMAAARTGAPEGEVIVADHQTAGRGRRGRSWVAPPGTALLASVLLRPRLPTERTALLSPAAALAVRDACAAAGAGARLKWPNDVIVPDPREAKLAGVLAELHAPATGGAAVVVGFGVNLRSHETLAAAVAAEAAAGETGFAPLPPVCLEELVAGPVHRNELLVSVLLRLDTWYRRLHDAGGEKDLVDELRRHSATIGRDVQVLTPGGPVAGRAADLTPEGKLVVATTDGAVEIAAGDCRHLRFGTA